MPRRNGNHIHSARGGQKRRKKQQPRLGIDWDLAEARHYGRDTDPFARSSRPTTQKEKVKNEFQRHIFGFSSEAVELLLGYKLDNVDQGSFVPVTFTGRTEKPLQKIDLKKPSLVQTPGGLVVLTSMVSGSNIEEIGNGSYRIEQVEAPELEGYDSPKRLNVVLGREPANFNAPELSRYIADGALALSRVMTVNDTEVSRRDTTASIDRMWNGAPRHDIGYSNW